MFCQITWFCEFSDLLVSISQVNCQYLLFSSKSPNIYFIMDFIYQEAKLYVNIILFRVIVHCPTVGRSLCLFSQSGWWGKPEDHRQCKVAIRSTNNMHTLTTANSKRMDPRDIRTSSAQYIIHYLTSDSLSKY